MRILSIVCLTTVIVIVINVFLGLWLSVLLQSVAMNSVIVNVSCINVAATITCTWRGR